MVLRTFWRFLAFALMLTACNSFKFDNLDEKASLTKDKIIGVSQKGPFAINSTVILFELSNSLEQTGRQFIGTMDDKGAFEIKSIELLSPYALLKADGFYRNEVTGRISAAQITLFAIADIKDRNSVNVNILTHLEYHRVQALTEQGVVLKAAKEQALGEILAVFGINNSTKNSEDMSIFGKDEGDAALLAISVLLQGGLGEGSFSSLLGNFSQSFRDDGKWEDNASKAALADWASEADLEVIRDNIKSWNLSASIPDFESHIYNFWVSSYALGVCNSASEGVERENGNAFSNHKNYLYVCKGGKWEFSRDNSCVTGKCDGKCYDQSTQFCSTQDNKIYAKCDNAAYDTDKQFCLSGKRTAKCDGYAYEAWQFCVNGLVENKCGGVASGATYNPLTEQCCGTEVCSKSSSSSSILQSSSAVVVESSSSATPSSSSVAPSSSSEVASSSSVAPSSSGGLCAGFVNGTKREHYGKEKPQFCDERDGKKYVYVNIGTQTWIAENLNYEASGSNCYSNNASNCTTYGRLYDWSTAMALDATCNSSSCVSLVQTPHKGICPQGWHIPSDADWTTLMSFVGGALTAGKKLKATSGWNDGGNGTDNFGFSALPGGLGNTGKYNNTFYNADDYGNWWSASENDNANANGRYMGYDGEYAYWSYYYKTSLLSVRCLQDD